LASEVKDNKDYPLGDDDDQVDVEENSLDDSQPWPELPVHARWLRSFLHLLFLGV
jgi:hypothetical protein